jgi:hypothetical protein
MAGICFGGADGTIDDALNQVLDGLIGAYGNA